MTSHRDLVIVTRTKLRQLTALVPSSAVPDGSTPVSIARSDARVSTVIDARLPHGHAPLLAWAMLEVHVPATIEALLGLVDHVARLGHVFVARVLDEPETTAGFPRGWTVIFADVPITSETLVEGRPSTATFRHKQNGHRPPSAPRA